MRTRIMPLFSAVACCFLLLLLASSAALGAEKRAPLLQEGKKTLFQRVVVFLEAVDDLPDGLDDFVPALAGGLAPGLGVEHLQRAPDVRQVGPGLVEQVAGRRLARHHVQHAQVPQRIERLLPGVLDGTVDPGRVFDRELPLDDAAQGYALMDQRAALKVLLRP